MGLLGPDMEELMRQALALKNGAAFVLAVFAEALKGTPEHAALRKAVLRLEKENTKE